MGLAFELKRAALRISNQDDIAPDIIANAPRVRTLAHAVGEADKLLPALGCGSDDDQQALRGIFETGLHVNAVDPEVDVAFGREIALAPARVLFGPGLLEASNGRGR